MDWSQIKTVGESLGAWEWVIGIFGGAVGAIIFLKSKLMPKSNAELLKVTPTIIVNNEERTNLPDLKTCYAIVKTDIQKSFTAQIKKLPENKAEEFIEKGTRVYLKFYVETKRTNKIKFKFQPLLTRKHREMLKACKIKEKSTKSVDSIVNENQSLSHVAQLNIGGEFYMKRFTLDIWLYDFNGRKSKRFSMPYILED